MAFPTDLLFWRENSKINYVGSKIHISKGAKWQRNCIERCYEYRYWFSNLNGIRLRLACQILKTVAWILVLGREIQTFEDYFWCHAGRRKTLCKVKKQLMMNDLSHLSKLSKLMQNIESERRTLQTFLYSGFFPKINCNLYQVEQTNFERIEKSSCEAK